MADINALLLLPSRDRDVGQGLPEKTSPRPSAPLAWIRLQLLFLLSEDGKPDPSRWCPGPEQSSGRDQKDKAGHGSSPLDLHARLLSPVYRVRDGDTELLLNDGPRHTVLGGDAGLGVLCCRTPPPTGNRGWGETRRGSPSPHRRQRLGGDQAGLVHSMLCQGHTRTLCGQHLRPALCLSCAVQAEKSCRTGQGRMATVSPVSPGAWGSGRGGNGEGPQWEGERAGGLFLEGSQSAEAEESQERSASQCGSNLQLGSRLQLAGMRPARAWDLLSPAEMVRGGDQGLIPVPCIQIPAAGAWAFPAGFSSLSFSM